MHTFFEIFLFIDVFIIGAITAIALRHGYAHLHPHPDEKNEHHTPEHKEANLTKEARDKLVMESEDRYRHIMERSAEQLDKDLEATVESINQTVKKLAADLTTKELAAIQQLFKQYQDGAVKDLEGSKNQTEAYVSELKAKLDSDLAQEKQRLTELIDNKLADAVMSFLTEAMQHEIDLGSQADYLLKQLDEHKDEFKQALNS